MVSYPELKRKVVVISGASGNLGTAVVQRFHAEGARLALIDRNAENTARLLNDLKLDSKTTLTGTVDLLKSVEIGQFIDAVAATFGQIDILVNTAGGYKPGAPVYELDEGTWDFLVNLNVKTTFLLSAAVARQMVKQGNRGRIVNVAGRAALKGDATISAYSVGKSGLLRLTESMSAELLDNGITVNAVLPSVIDTPQNREANPNVDYGKWVTPESIAEVIVFLASDGARDISGAAIPIYGRA
jgi:NAD(P)-dependent dehydrogenase (short-subunit alcohol dehydrogenase family)